MSKIKYYYDKKTLSYKPIESTGIDKFKNFIVYFTSSAILAFFILLIFFQYFDSPKEKRLKSEIKNLISQYEIINSDLEQIELVLDDIQKRDDNIYRTIFEADPIPTSIRKQGFGGVNRYKKLSGYSNSDLIINLSLIHI